MGLNFEFVLELLFELLNDHGTGGVLFLVFRGGKVLRAEVFIVERRDKVLFGFITVTVDVLNQRLGIALVPVEICREVWGLGERVDRNVVVLVDKILTMMEGR
jgi:hypothetical protein